MTETIAGDGFRLRRAGPEDVDFFSELVSHDDVEPYLAAVGPKDPSEVREEIDASLAEPRNSGRFVIEVEQNGMWQRAGVMAFDLANRRSRIANLRGLAVHPDFRGRKLSDEAARVFQRYLIFDLGFHRLQLEIYGFNERAIRHAERAGFVREGVKRKAYHRHGEWVDGVMFGLVREDLEG
ncbi:MAG TPA: GNAT family protein [Gaiellaceae bacterium]|nr:GNAT family protein [Gaiellaceae bacterium]